MRTSRALSPVWGEKTKLVIDVGEPARNLILNACFFAILLLVVVGLVPWKTLGAVRFSNLLRWLVLPVLGLGVLYEWVMPSRFDIRVDLFILLPAYLLAIATSVTRWLARRRAVS